MNGSPRFPAHLACLAALWLSASSCLALNPNAPTSSYIRTDFTVENGLPSNVVNAIVQTRNGFLWIGTGAGLTRFNGRQFLPIYFRSPAPISQGIVQALAEGLDGDLWVGTGIGLVRIARPALDFFDRSLTTVYNLGPGPSNEVNCLHVTRKGELWVGTNNGLYRFENGRFVSVLPGVNSEIHEAADGHLLIIANGRLVEWNGTGFVEHPDFAQKLGVGAQDFMDVIQDRHGTTWICTLGGLAKSEKGGLCKFYFYGQAKRPVGAHRAYEDHQGNMWIEFRGGLYRISAAKPGSRELLVLSAARAIYSDRDGDLWVGTNGDGLLRFKDRLVTMFTKESGLPNDTTMTVLSRRDGSLWVGSNCGGLSVLDGRRFRVYTEKDGLTNSCVWALAEDAQNN
ncbi:MAG: hypothetical protein JO185_24480, partial [Acidobacteriaceae bacterium]|nr:hypothetical protein [Acidobacteriaceae bacterium]